MFTTLRHGFGEGEPFVSVETTPPFDKDQQPLRAACEACRAKKIRCVKGANGCLRCMNQKRKCKYQTRSNFGSAAASRNRDGDRETRNSSSSSSSSPAPASISASTNDSGEGSASQQQNKVQKQKRWSHPRPDKSWSSSSSSSTSSFKGTRRASSNRSVGAPDGEEDEIDSGQVQVVLDMDFLGGTNSPEPIPANDTATGAGASSSLGTQDGSRAHQQNEAEASAGSSTIALSDSSPTDAHGSLMFAFDDVNFLDDDALDFSWSPESTEVTPLGPPGTCSCMSTAVGIYEAIQVELIWNPQRGGVHAASSTRSNSASLSPTPPPSSSSSSSTGSTGGPPVVLTEQTILQRQKTALARFESLLWCEACWTRSDYVMLIVTMCERILTSLETVVELLGRGGSEQREASDACMRLEVAAGGPPLPSLSSMTFHPNSAGFRVPSTGGIQKQGLRLGDWHLDNDDEVVVLTSLLKARMARLGNMIAMAEGVVAANVWPAHQRMTQELRMRFDKLMFSLSVGGQFVPT